MTFDWDDANRAHIARHDVTSEEAEQVFRNGPIDLEIQEDDEDGIRYPIVGETNALRILVIVSMEREGVIRVVTAWDAPKGYKDFYLSEKRTNL